MNDKLGILIQALLDPDSTKNIESQIKNLQALFDKSPLRVKLDVDDVEFKNFSNTLQKLSASLNKQINLSEGFGHADKITQKFVALEGSSEKLVEEITEFKNELNQSVTVIDTIEQSVDELGKTIQKVVKSQKIITDDNKQRIYSELKKNIDEIYKIENKLLTTGKNETIELEKQLKLLKDKQQTLLAQKAKGGYDDERENLKLNQYELQKILEYRTKIAQIKDKEELKAQAAYEKTLQYEQRVRQAIEQSRQKEKEKTQELEKQIELYKLRMFGDGKIKGELDIFEEKYKGKYDQEVLSRLREEIRGLSIETPNAEDKIKQFSVALSSMRQAAAQSSNVLERTFENFVKFMRFYLVGGTFVKIVNAFKEGLDVLKEIDTQLVSIAKVTDYTTQEMKALASSAIEVGKQYGRSAIEYLSAVTEFARAGFGKEAEQLGKISILLQNVGDVSAQTANEMLLAVNAAYELGGSQEKLIRVVDMLNEVSNRNPTSVQKMAEGISVAANVFKQAGFSIEEFIALVGTATSATQRSGSETARALRTVLMNIRQVVDDEAETTTESISKAEAVLRSVGIEIRKTTGAFREPMEILRDLAKVYKELGEQGRTVKQAEVLEALAGKRQSNVLAAVLGQFGMVEKQLQEALNSSGSAIKENEIYMQSWEAKIKQLGATITGFWNNFVNTDAIKGFIDFLRNAISALDILINNPISSFISKTAIMTTAVYGLSKAFTALIVKIQTANIALKASPIFWIAGILSAIQLAVGIFDRLNVSAEEQKEKIAEVQTEYEKTKAELEEVNRELQTTQERIEELSKLKDAGIISAVENDELEKLKLTNRELELRRQLLEEINEENRQRVADETVAYFEKKYGKYDISDGRLRTLESYADNFWAAVQNERNNVALLIAAYEELQEKKQEALAAGDEEAYESIKESLETIKGWLSEAREGRLELLDIKNILLQIEKPTEKQKNILSIINKILEETEEIVGDISDKPIISPDSGEGIGYTAEELNKLNDQLDEISKTISQHSSNIDTLSSVYRSLANNEKLTAKQVLELVTLYPQFASELVKINDNKNNAIKLTQTLFEIEKKRYIHNLEQEKELLKAKASILALEMTTAQWYEHYYSGGRAGGTKALREVKDEILSIEEIINYIKGLTIDDFTKPSKSSSKSYTPKSRLEALKELLDVEKISLQEYYNELIKIEQSAYKDYENKSVAQLEALLTSTNEKIAKKAEEALDLRKEINRVRAELFKETEYDKAITSLDNELAKLGNINTPEELARQAEILGQKFVLAQQEVSRLEEQLKDPSLTESLRKLLEDKKIKIEIDIVKFKDQAEQLLRDYYEIEREISEKSLQSRFDKQLAYYEKQIYNGLTKDAWEEASKSRIQGYEEEIKRLREQNDLIEERIKREKYLADIEKQRTIVANLQKERTVRVYREGEGWVWEVDQKKLKDATEKLANLEEEYYNWESQLKRERRIRELQENIEHERQMQEEKRKSYEQQKRLLDEQLQYEKLELEKHYLDIDALVAEGLDEIKGTYEEKWDEILKVLQDRLSRARQIMKEIEELNIKTQQATLSVNVVTPTINSSSANVYDSGGRLPSGALGINLSGKDEFVLSPTQTKAWVKLVDHLVDLSKVFDNIKSFKMPSLMPAVAGGGIIENHYHFDNLNVTTPDAQTFIKVLPTLVKQYKNR